MQPEQPSTTPSQGAPAPDGAASEPTSDQPKEGSSPGWWQRLFSRRPAAQEANSDEGGESSDQASTSAPLKLTQEELDRRIQAETDRREAKRASEQRAAERKRLRDEDPWAYAQQEREAEQTAQQDSGLQSFFANVGVSHDRVSIDPIMELLPVEERERIMKIEGAGRGLEGRALVVREAMKSLEKHWKTEGEKEAAERLRRNSAFRKQVMAEHRSGFVEPELLPAFSGSATDKKVSEILRTYYGLPGPSRHNSAS